MIEIDERMLTEALNKVASTQDGQIILSCLKEFCHFDSDIISSDPVDTQANANCRRAYLYLRRYIHQDHLKKIEFDYKRKAKNNDGRSTSSRDLPSDKQLKRVPSSRSLRGKDMGAGNLKE